jgi:hypothetical protein
MKAAISILLLLIASAPALAFFVACDGYGYQEGGFNPEPLAEEVLLVGRIDPDFSITWGLPEGFPFEPDRFEYTAVCRLEGGTLITDVGDTCLVYRGGSLEIYADEAKDADWSEAVDVDSPPVSFLNGELWLSGTFRTLSAVMSEHHPESWNMSGRLEYSGGAARDYFVADGADRFYGLVIGIEPHETAGYCFAVFLSIAGSYPPGSDVSSWSDIKALFQ